MESRYHEPKSNRNQGLYRYFGKDLSNIENKCVPKTDEISSFKANSKGSFKNIRQKDNGMPELSQFYKSSMENQLNLQRRSNAKAKTNRMSSVQVMNHLEQLKTKNSPIKYGNQKQLTKALTLNNISGDSMLLEDGMYISQNQKITQNPSSKSTSPEIQLGIRPKNLRLRQASKPEPPSLANHDSMNNELDDHIEQTHIDRSLRKQFDIQYMWHHLINEEVD
jgi:hypothetical protein